MIRSCLAALAMVFLVAVPAAGRCELVELVERADRLRDELLPRLHFVRLADGDAVGHGRGESLQCGPAASRGQYRLDPSSSLDSMLRSCEDFGRIMAPLLDELRRELDGGRRGLRFEGLDEDAPVSDGRWARSGTVARLRWLPEEVDEPAGTALLLERIGALLSFQATLGRGLLVEAGLDLRLRLLLDERRWVAYRVVPVPYTGTGFVAEGLRLEP